MVSVAPPMVKVPAVMTVVFTGLTSESLSEPAAGLASPVELPTEVEVANWLTLIR
ncbi:hypothetical protein D3C72_2037730 [compost metagenome]